MKWTSKATFFAAAWFVAGIVYAQDKGEYPIKPIHLIVGFSPGGSADTVGRALAEGLSTRLGQPVVVENKAGANGNIAAEYVARSAPDGYVLYFPSIGHAVNASLYKNLPYDPVKDFTPISFLASTPNVLIVNKQLGVSNVHELIELAKAKPNQLTFGSSGVGTSLHMSGELFKEMAGVQIRHIPYKGMGPLIADVIGGQVEMGVAAVPAVQGHLKSGDVIDRITITCGQAQGHAELPVAFVKGAHGCAGQCGLDHKIHIGNADAQHVAEQEMEEVADIVWDRRKEGDTKRKHARK